MWGCGGEKGERGSKLFKGEEAASGGEKVGRKGESCSRGRQTVSEGKKDFRSWIYNIYV